MADSANGDDRQRKPMHPEECDTLLLAALEAQDIDACVALYESVAVVFSKAGSYVAGPDAIRDVYMTMIALKPRFSIEFVQSVTTADGSLAINRMKARMDWQDRKGKTRASHFHSMEVARKQADGSWRFVIDDPYGSMRDSLGKE